MYGSWDLKQGTARIIGIFSGYKDRGKYLPIILYGKSFLLSGPFCCLGCSGVVFFAVWAGASCFFCCLGGGPGPAQTAKKKHDPAQTAKNKTRPRPFRACFCFCCLGGGACSFFCCLGGGRFFFFAVWAGGVLFFLLFGRGGVFFFLLFGPGAFFFAVWAGGVLFFLLFGQGACCFFCCLGGGRVLFFAVWAGGFFFLLFGRGTGVHSLTRLPGSSLSDPTTKKTEQPKKTTRVPIFYLHSWGSLLLFWGSC